MEMKYFYALLLALFLVACGDNGHKNQITYKFTDQQDTPIKIQTDLDTFDIYKDTSNPQDIEKTTFIMFFDLSSSASKNYLTTMNNLTTTFPKAYILGILTQKYSQAEVQDYIQKNHIRFTLLNPKDNKNLFNDFVKKINEENKKADTEDETKENVQKEQNTAKDGTKETDTQANTTIELPFFVLYDRHGKKYQTYTGIIPEEMFAHDIDSLRH